MSRRTGGYWAQAPFYRRHRMGFLAARDQETGLKVTAQRNRSRTNREGNCIRVLALAARDCTHSYRARQRGCAVLRRIEHKHQHHPWLCDICRRDGCFQLVTTNERRHAKGTVPAHRRVVTKIAPVDRQYELIASCSCVVGRNGADEGSRGADTAGRADQSQRYDKQTKARRSYPRRKGRARSRPHLCFNAWLESRGCQ
jgi:hypothetical protein